MIIHYNNALHPGRHLIPACNPGKAVAYKALAATTDRSKVTCKRCLAVLGGNK